jgi:hypothetical protein
LSDDATSNNPSPSHKSKYYGGKGSAPATKYSALNKSKDKRLRLKVKKLDQEGVSSKIWLPTNLFSNLSLVMEIDQIW